MNRLFGITGFLAAGMTFFWVMVITELPWLMGNFTYSSQVPPTRHWALLAWGAICIVGISVVFSFFRRSLKGHWAALRHNAPMSPAAWRGVCGVYLLLMLAFALPLLADDPSGSHRTERYLYIGLAGCCLALGVLAARRGVSHSTHDSPSTGA